jgi:hypothetical protein
MPMPDWCGVLHNRGERQLRAFAVQGEFAVDIFVQLHGMAEAGDSAATGVAGYAGSEQWAQI